MKIEQYKQLNDVEEEKEIVIGIDDLTDKNERTLLYGYTCNSKSWHVYLKDGEIHTVIYHYGEKPRPLSIETNQGYTPDKRLYPERCDYEFCVLLKQKGVHLPFTTWNDETEPKRYYGEIL